MTNKTTTAKTTTPAARGWYARDSFFHAYGEKFSSYEEAEKATMGERNRQPGYWDGSRWQN